MVLGQYYCVGGNFPRGKPKASMAMAIHLEVLSIACKSLIQTFFPLTIFSIAEPGEKTDALTGSYSSMMACPWGPAINSGLRKSSQLLGTLAGSMRHLLNATTCIELSIATRFKWTESIIFVGMSNTFCSAIAKISNFFRCGR